MHSGRSGSGKHLGSLTRADFVGKFFQACFTFSQYLSMLISLFIITSLVIRFFWRKRGYLCIQLFGGGNVNTCISGKIEFWMELADRMWNSNR